MEIHNPPHPGEFIKDIYLEPAGLSCRAAALMLGVSPSTLGRILNGDHGITPSMALKLSRTLGRSPESWLNLQEIHDAWKTKLAVAKAKDKLA